MRCPYCGKETDKSICPKCYAAIQLKKIKKETKK